MRQRPGPRNPSKVFPHRGSKPRTRIALPSVCRSFTEPSASAGACRGSAGMESPLTFHDQGAELLGWWRYGSGLQGRSGYGWDSTYIRPGRVRAIRVRRSPGTVYGCYGPVPLEARLNVGAGKRAACPGRRRMGEFVRLAGRDVFLAAYPPKAWGGKFTGYL